MPILWRYALQNYLRVLLLSTCTFISILIIIRFKEIARFTALSGDFGKTGLFIVYQIPTILPIAIPISALIASLLLFQRLSQKGELGALRASGLSLRIILSPLLMSSILLAIFNFFLCIDAAPFCRRAAKNLLYHETSQNPLLLLQRQKLVKLKNAYLDMQVKDDETIKDLILIVHNENNKRLNLFSADKLWMEKEQLLGKDLSIISYIGENIGFDSLVIENQASMSTPAPQISAVLKKNTPHFDLSALSLKMLRLSTKKSTHVEILRRVSLSLAVFSFTLLGCSFGIEQGRVASKKNLIFALLLSLLVLMSYSLGKELKKHPTFATFAYIFPHPFIWACSSLHLYRISKGRT